MKHIVRLTVLVLMGSLPVACGPTAGHAGAVVPPLEGNSFVVRSACESDGQCVLEQARVVIRAGHTTARALGTAIRATGEAFRLAGRRLTTPGVPGFKNEFDVRRAPGQPASRSHRSP